MVEGLAIATTAGERLSVDVIEYPASPVDQMALVELWQSEWQRTDYDWLRALKGDYAETLTTRSYVVRQRGQTVASATIAFPRLDPEVCVVGNVVTRVENRGLGIAATLTDVAVRDAFSKGCQVAYLGATIDPRNVYLRCGFRPVSGSVMRRAAQDGDNPEDRLYRTRQSFEVRPAEWGDLPSVSCFLAQPWASMVLDYPRGLMSGRYVALQRCVSNFPFIYDEVLDRGGAMGVLIGEKRHRVLGFGSLTPGPGHGRGHRATIDVAVHDEYDHAPLVDFVLAEARRRGITHVEAMVAAPDERKRHSFEAAGMRNVATLADQLRVGGLSIDVNLLEGTA